MKNEIVHDQFRLENPQHDEPVKSIVLYSRDMDFCVSLSLLFQDRYKIMTVSDPELLLTTVKTFEPDLVIADTVPTERMQRRFYLMKTTSPLLRIMLFYAAHYGDERRQEAVLKTVDAAFSKPIDIEEVTRQINTFMANDP